MGIWSRRSRQVSEAFSAVEIIAAKRDKHELTDAQIDWVISAYTRGVVQDEQMSALLMSILLNGMSNHEIFRWTDAMIKSGERMSWSKLSMPTVDKHSTGGVGDKITLPLAPLVAACGAAVPQLSGRGLGHTGGTLDKLESIPGWRATLSNEEMLTVLQECGAVICAAGAGLAPADRKLYALRDVTGTVPSIPLIASSIMSKKIAEGTSALVLDVKTGSGAFMVDQEDAKLLARTMVDLGTRAGVKTRALVTAMDIPLGLTAGNALEVRESIEVLAGGGPSDVVELTLLLATEMLELAGVSGKDPAAALKDGSAMDHWRRMIKAQGGDPDAKLPVAKESQQVVAQADGLIRTMDAMKVGVSAWLLGAGRSRQGEKIQAGAGIEIHAKPGEIIKKGAPLFTLHTDEPERFARSTAALDGAVSISNSNEKVDRLPLVVARIEGNN
ncbi:MAG: thymidine phosphorylase [Actinobacteria bacterium]|nr:thymidine phosphorylase [Actinomycetota bacterium]